MKKPKKDPIREERIENEAIVDTYGPEEQALGWYYYLENKIRFPFQARCTVTKAVSPLRKDETVEILRMALKTPAPPICLVRIRWQSRTMAVPLSQLTPLDADESTAEAIDDWHYWVAQGYLFLSSHRPTPALMRASLRLGSIVRLEHMVRRQSKSQPTWADVKAKLANFNHAGLVNLLRDLYSTHRDNQTFLHARFGLGTDVLKTVPADDKSVALA